MKYASDFGITLLVKFIGGMRVVGRFCSRAPSVSVRRLGACLQNLNLVPNRRPTGLTDDGRVRIAQTIVRAGTDIKSMPNYYANV